MTRGLSAKQYGCFLILRGLLALIITAGLSGCAPSSESSPQVVCTPNPSNINVYRVTPQALTNIIFQFSVSPPIPLAGIATPTMLPSAIIDAMQGISSTPMPSQSQSSRYAALQYLINETKRWSDIETIKLDDFSEVQILVTFISPELLQAVFLNEVLKQGVLFPDFDAKTQAMLNTVAARDELLFLLTITTTNIGGSNLSSHSINIPIRDMVLTNGEDLPIAPKHDDHNLDQPINSVSRSVFGYLAYPLAVLKNGECKWVLEPKYNTSIVITVPLIQMDEGSNGPYTWTIPYSPLIHADTPPDLTILMIPLGFDQTLFSPLTSPPDGNIYQTNNWQDYARFVWNQIVLGNY
jgi:hypothetical protein